MSGRTRRTRLAGDLGDHARGRPAADRAAQHLAGVAAAADRPFRGADGDALPASAADAVLEIVRVVDQAVRTQRLPVGSPGGRLVDPPAAAARDCAGPGGAGAAGPLPVYQLAQGDHAPAERAGGALNPGGSRLAE